MNVRHQIVLTAAPPLNERIREQPEITAARENDMATGYDFCRDRKLFDCDPVTTDNARHGAAVGWHSAVAVMGGKNRAIGGDAQLRQSLERPPSLSRIEKPGTRNDVTFLPVKSSRNLTLDDTSSLNSSGVWFQMS